MLVAAKTGTHTYHKQQCSYAKRIKEEGRLHFYTRKEAEHELPPKSWT